MTRSLVDRDGGRQRLRAPMPFEIIATFAILIVGFALPDLGKNTARFPTRLFRAVARRKRLAVVLVGTLAFLMSSSLSLFVHWPVPAVHDEFCYLLGADTFARGTLTNPTHPMWEHFETFHVIHHPTYQMKYPPGQAIALAAGQLAGHPVVGVWISHALACAAVCWALYGWMPPRWALFGGVILLLNPRMTIWWSQSYWGGAVAMLGGALVFGAARRLVSQARVGDSILFGIGLAVLANSRPYEGLVASLCTPLVLVPWLFAGRPRLTMLCKRVVLPLAAVLLAAAAWMGYYHYRVTGNPLRMPYQVWQQTYGRGHILSATLFSQSTSTLGGAERRLIRFPKSENGAERRPREAKRRPLSSRFRKIVDQWSFYLGITLTLSLVAVMSLWRRPWTRLAIVTTLLVMLAVLLQDTWGHPHYAAPVCVLILVIVVEGLRQVRCWRIAGRPAGRACVHLLPGLLLILAMVKLVDWSSQPVLPFHAWSLARAALATELLKNADPDLVVVRYGRDHHKYQEWVYNEADIDAAEVVWARELSPEEDARLREYFHDRRIWLLEPDEIPPRLTRYRTQETLEP